MKTRIIIAAFAITASTFMANSLMAQDIHLSQYDASPMLLNPGLTGMNQDIKYRIVHQYRNQWDALAHKSYLSSALAYDMPFKKKWGLGGYILNDNSNRIFNSFNFVLSGAHDITIANQDKHHLCVGLQAGLMLKSLRHNELTFDQQYTDGGFDTELPTGESFERAKRFMPEVSLGMAYLNTDETKKYHPYGGLSFHHVTYPKDNFLSSGDVSHLPIRFQFHGGCHYKINDKIDIDPGLLIMKQRNAWEFNMQVKGWYSIEDSDFRLMGAVGYRVKDAVVGQIGLFYKNFVYRISYDMNVSPLKTYSKYKGGLEFSLTFFKKFGGQTARM